MADDNAQDQVEKVEEKTEEVPANTSDGGRAISEDSSEVGKPAEKPAKPAKSVSASLEKIIEQIEKLSVLELSDLVHTLEERFGVSAIAPVTTVSVGAGQAGEAASDAEEKTTFNVILSGTGVNKISAIKAVRELVPTLGLKEAKDLVEAAPKVVLEGVGKETAEAAKKKLTEAGGTVELQ